MAHMKSIYVHLSPDKFTFSNELDHSNYTYSGIPEYAKYSFSQTEKFLKEKPIIITNDDIDIYGNEIQEFYKICKNGFPSFYKDPFWLTTLLRLYIVFLYVQDKNINEFIHLEYDNVLYSNLQCLSCLPSKVYFCKVGPQCGSAGFVYCNNIDKYREFILKLNQLLKKGESIVSRYTQYSNLSEMILIDLINTHTTDIIDYLPLLEGDNHFDKLNMVFDGASYGQYLGGTNNGGECGWYGLHHYVGQKIHNDEIGIVFEGGLPFVKNIKTNNKIHIGNLHIHSKQLHKFI